MSSPRRLTSIDRGLSSMASLHVYPHSRLEVHLAESHELLSEQTSALRDMVCPVPPLCILRHVLAMQANAVTKVAESTEKVLSKLCKSFDRAARRPVPPPAILLNRPLAPPHDCLTCLQGPKVGNRCFKAGRDHEQILCTAALVSSYHLSR